VRSVARPRPRLHTPLQGSVIRPAGSAPRCRCMLQQQPIAAAYPYRDKPRQANEGASHRIARQDGGTTEFWGVSSRDAAGG
jgi:hypothetical protein